MFDPLYFNLNKLKEVLRIIPIANHNLKFDGKFIFYHYDILIKPYLCTLIAAQMGYAGLYKTYTLGDLVTRFFPQLKITKESRNEFIDKPVGSKYHRELLEYAARDSILTHNLVGPLIKRLVSIGSYKLYMNVENNLITYLTEAEIKGMEVDFDNLVIFYEEGKKELHSLYKDLQSAVKELDPTKLAKKYHDKEFNPGSPSQVPEFLKAAGVEVQSTQKAELNEVSENNDNKFLKKVITYRDLDTKINKTVKGWIEKSYNTKTKSIHTSFRIAGCETRKDGKF